MLCSHKKQFLYLKTKKTASTSVEVLFERHCVPAWFGEVPVETGQVVTEVGIIGSRRGGRTAADRFYNHMPAADIRSALGDEIFGRYFKFGMMRNPFDKTVSRFWWIFRNHPERLEQLRGGDFAEIRELFSQYVRARGPRLADDRNVYTIDGQVVADRFIRFENLEADLQEVCGQLAVPYTAGALGRLNGGTRRREENFWEYYDRASRDVIRTVFGMELERFSYQCGPA